MLYTKNGDDGKTCLFGCDQRISKSSSAIEAIGDLDELSSFLGICKTKAKGLGIAIGETALEASLENIQKELSAIMAKLAGATKDTPESNAPTEEAERLIAEAEKVLPPIKSFVLSGASELSALLDTSRAMARRAERRVVKFYQADGGGMLPHSLEYLNRLSSLLYAMARIADCRPKKPLT